MDLKLSHSQQVLVDSARRFFDRTYPLDRMRDIYLSNDEFEPTLWRDICDLGWNAAALPEAVGGFEGGLVEATLLLLEMGRGGCLTPFPHSSVAAALALFPQNTDLAARIANSQAVVIPVSFEMIGKARVLDRGKLQLHAKPVSWACLATHLLCEVNDRAYLVAVTDPAVQIQSVKSSRGEPLSEIRLDGAEATEIARAGALFNRIRDYGAFACAALLQGISERALDLAVAYAKERIQFGRPIGSFQAIQHKAADMRIATEVGRVLVLRAAAEREPARFSAAASRAKAWNADTARKVTREAMQIFGGISFAGDHVTQLLYQSVITLANHYGTAHEHRAQLAAQLLG